MFYQGNDESGPCGVIDMSAELNLLPPISSSELNYFESLDELVLNYSESGIMPAGSIMMQTECDFTAEKGGENDLESESLDNEIKQNIRHRMPVTYAQGTAVTEAGCFNRREATKLSRNPQQKEHISPVVGDRLVDRTKVRTGVRTEVTQAQTDADIPMTRRRAHGMQAQSLNQGSSIISSNPKKRQRLCSQKWKNPTPKRRSKSNDSESAYSESSSYSSEPYDSDTESDLESESSESSERRRTPKKASSRTSRSQKGELVSGVLIPARFSTSVTTLSTMPQSTYASIISGPGVQLSKSEMKYMEIGVLSDPKLAALKNKSQDSKPMTPFILRDLKLQLGELLVMEDSQRTFAPQHLKAYIGLLNLRSELHDPFAIQTQARIETILFVDPKASYKFMEGAAEPCAANPGKSLLKYLMGELKEDTTDIIFPVFMRLSAHPNVFEWCAIFVNFKSARIHIFKTPGKTCCKTSVMGNILREVNTFLRNHWKQLRSGTTCPDFSGVFAKSSALTEAIDWQDTGAYVCVLMDLYSTGNDVEQLNEYVNKNNITCIRRAMVEFMTGFIYLEKVSRESTSRHT